MFDGRLKLLIADDEAPARSRLRELVEDIGGWSLVAEAANGTEALELCRRHTPDAVLLDIRMPGMDGIEVASHLAALNPPPAIVFTTAYDEYAVKAFETNAIGYLLKPVRRERLLRSLERAARVSRWQLEELVRNAPELGGRRSIPVVGRERIRLIPVAEISSFQADQKYVRMVHDGGEDLIDESLKTLEEEFAEEFVRVHRNSLVRLARIAELERGSDGQLVVRMRDGMSYPVARRNVAELKRRLG